MSRPALGGEGPVAADPRELPAPPLEIRRGGLGHQARLVEPSPLGPGRSLGCAEDRLLGAEEPLEGLAFDRAAGRPDEEVGFVEQDQDPLGPGLMAEPAHKPRVEGEMLLRGEDQRGAVESPLGVLPWPGASLAPGADAAQLVPGQQAAAGSLVLRPGRVEVPAPRAGTRLQRDVGKIGGELPQDLPQDVPPRNEHHDEIVASVDHSQVDDGLDQQLGLADPHGECNQESAFRLLEPLEGPFAGEALPEFRQGLGAGHDGDRGGH